MRFNLNRPIQLKFFNPLHSHTFLNSLKSQPNFISLSLDFTFVETPLSSKVRRHRRRRVSFCRSMKEAPSSSSKSCRRRCHPRVVTEDLKTSILHRIPSPMVWIAATLLRRGAPGSGRNEAVVEKAAASEGSDEISGLISKYKVLFQILFLG